jgi:hypothetical protein
VTLLEKLWRLLPDRCQVPDCKRHGVRGNENIVEGFRVCDECHVANFGAIGGDNTKAIMAAIHAEREAIAAARKSVTLWT